MAQTAPPGAREAGSHAAPMTHRQIMEALSGLLLGMFVAILSSTIVSNALPRIISDLGGGQSAYTWVVTAALLATTASTPLWGKLADLTSKKVLVQTSLIVFVTGSLLAGLSQNIGTLITFRVVQGIGAGGLTALSQVIMAAMISPRERGRYSGYLGATFAVATVGGPLIGGVIVDTDWLGWRWCFYVGAPFAVIALIVLQKTLRLPVLKRDVKIDWAGAFFITASVSLLLIWVSLAGDKYDWLSWQTAAMVGGSVLLAVVFVLVESRAAEPIIPLRLFRNRTISLTSAASLFVGLGMFGGTVFLSQYFQLARNESPTMSGVLTIPMIAGLFLSSTVSGLVITRTGRWKAWLISGGVLLTAGLGLLGTIHHDTDYWQVALFMGLVGIGVGMMMQNLVLATQNQVAPQDLGSASSAVAFFRTLGGAVGVSALGAVLGHRVTDYMKDGLAALGIKGGDGSGTIPDMSALPAPVRTVVESAYGDGIADIFLVAAPAALVALLLLLFVKEVPLRTSSSMQQAAEGAEGKDAASGAPVAAAAGTAETAAVVTAAGHAPSRTPGPRTAAEPVPSAARPDGSAAAELLTAASPVALDSADGDGDSAPGSGTGITGHVRSGEGAPVARATLTLISLTGRQLGRATAHGDGSYELPVPGAGSYVLIAAADGHQPQASTVVVGDGPLVHDVLLAGTGGLAGTVRSAAGGTGAGAPVAGAMVVVTDVRGEVLATGTTGPDGGFLFGELVSGTFTLAVTAAGHRPAAVPVAIEGTGTTRVEVELLPGAKVQGTVRAAHDGRPLADARVTLIDATGTVVGSARTGEDGAYAFADLDAGEYTLTASGYPPVAGALTVTGGGEEAFDVELGHPAE